MQCLDESQTHNVTGDIQNSEIGQPIKLDNVS